MTLARGASFTFEALPTSGNAGLYRASGSISGEEHLAGWVVLPKGEQRGSVTIEGAPSSAPRLDPQKRTVRVSGGTLEAMPVKPAAGGLEGIR